MLGMLIFFSCSGKEEAHELPDWYADAGIGLLR
jgi:hypothetical protein